MQLPCRIHAVGSALPPVEFVIAAKSVGPLVTCKLKAACSDIPPAISFGKIKVMQAESKTLSVTNTSLIPAEVKVFVAAKTSVFSVDRQEFRLLPGEFMDLLVSVRLDETYSFSDVLQILVTNGNELGIPLTAVGVGSTLTCGDICEQQIDFGPQIAGRPFCRSILVDNHGRRGCDVHWQNVTLDTVKKDLGRALRGTNGKQKLSVIPPDLRECFSVEPAKAFIPAKKSRHFIVRGASAHASNRREMLKLLSGQEVCC